MKSITVPERKKTFICKMIIGNVKKYLFIVFLLIYFGIFTINKLFHPEKKKSYHSIFGRFNDTSTFFFLLSLLPTATRASAN